MASMAARVTAGGRAKYSTVSGSSEPTSVDTPCRSVTSAAVYDPTSTLSMASPESANASATTARQCSASQSSVPAPRRAMRLSG